MSNFMSVVTRQANRLVLKAAKLSPEILIITGVVGTVVGTVMACKATAKAQEELKENIEEIETIRETHKNPPEGYTDSDYGKDMFGAYVRLGVKASKIYAPAAIVTTASLSSIIFSHRILCKRNIGLAAAYAALDKGFRQYRDRVTKDLGREADQKYRYGFEDSVVEVDVDDGDGNVVHETKVVKTVSGDPNAYSIYARFFDESSTEWSKDPEYNLSFLNGCQKLATAKLQAKGYLFLNEVYEMLGLDKSKAGQMVGWIYDPDDPCRDNYVDFNIYTDVHRKANRAFVNGYERSILLDFNVDGDILAEM